MAESIIKRNPISNLAPAPTNVDGNDFTETGIYHIRAISDNFPVGYGILFVMKSDYSMIQQVLFRPEAIYTRRSTDGTTWEVWKKVALTNA